MLSAFFVVVVNVDVVVVIIDKVPIRVDVVVHVFSVGVVDVVSVVVVLAVVVVDVFVSAKIVNRARMEIWIVRAPR